MTYTVAFGRFFLLFVASPFCICWKNENGVIIFECMAKPEAEGYFAGNPVYVPLNSVLCSHF